VVKSFISAKESQL